MAIHIYEIFHIFNTHTHWVITEELKNQCKQGMVKKTDENKKKKHEKRCNYYRIRMSKKGEGYAWTEVGFLKLDHATMTAWHVQGWGGGAEKGMMGSCMRKILQLHQDSEVFLLLLLINPCLQFLEYCLAHSKYSTIFLITASRNCLPESPWWNYSVFHFLLMMLGLDHGVIQF